MDPRTYLRRFAVVLLALLAGVLPVGCSTNRTYSSGPAKRGAPIIVRVASARDSDPYQAGRRAGEQLKKQMGPTPAHAVLLAECFEGKSRKRKLLAGLASVLPRDILFGFSTYGSFTQDGCLDTDSVSLLGIAGQGLATAAALRTDLGIAGLTMEQHADRIARRLRAGGAELGSMLPRGPDDRLLIIMADAHSPKNRFLVEGAQQVFGKRFAITGGSANKNAGQTFTYFRGRMYTDAAVALLLSGDFSISMAGRQAKENKAVISSAGEAARQALEQAEGRPFSALAFDCAGRKGKLDDVSDELRAIQSATGKDLPLFGAYCAGEIGPADLAESDPAVLSTGVGWHVMFTVLGR